MYFDIEINALAINTHWDCGKGWNWCNPPYAKIEPWVEKAWRQTQNGAKTAMLLPAGVSCRWWERWVHNKAHVRFVTGRLTFIPCTTSCPKDLALLLYSPIRADGYSCWDWKAAQAVPKVRANGQE